jgi:acylglycerol lipase
MATPVAARRPDPHPSAPCESRLAAPLAASFSSPCSPAAPGRPRPARHGSSPRGRGRRCRSRGPHVHRTRRPHLVRPALATAHRRAARRRRDPPRSGRPSDRHAGFAERLVHAGFAVWAFDMRGHGRSAGVRVQIDRIDDLRDDLDAFVALVRDREPGRPIVLYGYSLGGLVTALYGIERHPQVAGVVLAAPGIAFDAPPIQASAIRLIAALAPNAPVLDVPHARFSVDRRVVAEMDGDPLIAQGSGPARSGRTAIAGAARVWAHPERLVAPLLVVHGRSDAITAPGGGRDLVARAGAADRTLRLYDGIHHDVLRDPGGDRVADDVMALDRRPHRRRRRPVRPGCGRPSRRRPLADDPGDRARCPRRARHGGHRRHRRAAAAADHRRIARLRRRGRPARRSARPTWSPARAWAGGSAARATPATHWAWPMRPPRWSACGSAAASATGARCAPAPARSSRSTTRTSAASTSGASPSARSCGAATDSLTRDREHPDAPSRRGRRQAPRWARSRPRACKLQAAIRAGHRPKLGCHRDR